MRWARKAEDAAALTSPRHAGRVVKRLTTDKTIVSVMRDQDHAELRRGALPSHTIRCRGAGPADRRGGRPPAQGGQGKHLLPRHGWRGDPDAASSPVLGAVLDLPDLLRPLRRTHALRLASSWSQVDRGHSFALGDYEGKRRSARLLQIPRGDDHQPNRS